MNRHYQRHLPHQVPEGHPIFLTWNLKGALPDEAIQKLQEEHQLLKKQPDRAGESPKDWKMRESKLLFAATDRFLDNASQGPLHLKDPNCARIVENSILFGMGDRYQLFAWCIMANHVHVLLLPR